MSTLNPQQQQAVETTQGALLILAGAGSGKTKVLTHRIAYLLQQKLAMPEEVLAVTFTNKAAAEMKERIAKLLGSSGMGAVRLPWMGTFHSICVKILKKDGRLVGLAPNFTIYDSLDQLDVVKQVMEELNLSQKEVNPRAIHSFISSAKNEFVLPSDYAKFAKGYFQELVASIYPKYNQILAQNNAVDFDDLLIKTLLLIKNHPEVLQKYMQLFKYILVDEYQDTNHVQYLLITTLAKGHSNLCVVGDDDQSIYAFRGATIRNILNFEQDYPQATVIKLEQNYRSTKTILDAAHQVVSKNKGRTNKKLWTQNPDGGQITIYTAESERDEADWIAKQIQTLISDSVHPEEVAVLYRTNAQSRALEEGLLKNTVAYRIVGGTRFYERKEIKDVLAYLRILHNPQDNNSVLRIINTPRRGIGAKSITDLTSAASAAGLGILDYLYASPGQQGPGLAKFALLIEQLKQESVELGLVDLIHKVVDTTGYIEMLKDGTSENEARIENIKELVSVAAKYHEAEPQVGLALFLEEVGLIEADSADDDSSGKVTLMTIHAAKGLEFEYVFVVGMEEGLFPHSRVFTDPAELEEERRLAYVAITRAKKQLYLTHAQARVYFGSRQENLVSRFVEDIDKSLTSHLDYWGGKGRSKFDSGWEEVSEDGWGTGRQAHQDVDLEIGLKVRHEYFGVGTVVKYDDSMVTINFGPIYGIKELARDFAPLEIC